MQISIIHSFRRGTGKTTIAANIATLLAVQGLRVALIDLNFPAPSLHILFGLDLGEIKYSVNDFLWGTCSIGDTVHNMSRRLRPATEIAGQIYLLPANPTYKQITRMLHGGYDIELLGNSFDTLSRELELDLLLIDAPAGLNEETLFTISRTDLLAVILRPDRQDYLGTGVILEVARRLSLPYAFLIVNEVPALLDWQNVKSQTNSVFDEKVAALLPHSDELLALASNGIFVLHYPQHPLTTAFKRLAPHFIPRKQPAPQR